MSNDRGVQVQVRRTVRDEREAVRHRTSSSRDPGTSAGASQDETRETKTGEMKMSNGGSLSGWLAEKLGLAPKLQQAVPVFQAPSYSHRVTPTVYSPPLVDASSSLVSTHASHQKREPGSLITGR